MIGCIVIAMKSPAPTNGEAKGAEVEKIQEIKIGSPVRETSEINTEIQKVPSAGGNLGEDV
jgi:hypothetical protein